MASLYDTAKSYAKKDLTSLPELDLKTLDVKKQAFEKNGQKGEYSYIEMDGWKYVVKAEVLSAIKAVIDYRPSTTKVKVYKDDRGELKVMPLD